MESLLLTGLVIVLLIGGSSAKAQDDKTKYLHNGKQITVVEALQLLAKDKNAEVFKCQSVDLKINKASIGLKKKD